MNPHIRADIGVFIIPSQALLESLPPIVFKNSLSFHEDFARCYKNSLIPRLSAEAVQRAARDHLERFLWQQSAELLAPIAAKLLPSHPPIAKNDSTCPRIKRRLVALVVVPLLASYLDYFRYLRAMEERDDSELDDQ